LDSLIENIPDMVFVKDAESLKFVRFNKASEEILGISQQEMIGKSDYDFFPADEAKHFIDDDRRVLAGNKVVDIPEEMVQTRHRGIRFLHTRKIPIFDSEGKPEFLLGISEDITDLKKAREENLRLAREEAALKEQEVIARRLEHLIAARDEFLSIASHELKTPITSLNLLLEMSQKLAQANTAPESDRLMQSLNLCQAQSKRLSAFVDDLLDVSRMKSGKLRMRLETCDLAKLVTGMIDQFSDFMKSGSALVSLKVEDHVVVDCDRFRIEQVILNLLSNATKYGEGKGVEIFVNRVGAFARLQVVDHGIGIPASMIDKIFERFERTELTQKISGLGLGLYISKQIVLAHHGRIYVESKEGQGSTFCVELPLFDGKTVPKTDHSSPDFDIPISQ
jgi:PAS domain S-box-containing protein